MLAYYDSNSSSKGGNINEIELKLGKQQRALI